MAGGLVGHHVAQDGDTVFIEGIVETDPECVQAHNSATPGLLVTREYDRTSDRWRVVHAPTGLVLHPAHRTYDFATAMRLAEKLGTICDWLKDEVRDSESVHVSTLVLCHLAALGKLDEVQ